MTEEAAVLGAGNMGTALAQVITSTRLLIVSVPSQVVRGLTRDIAHLVKPSQVVLNVAKGLEAGTHRRMSEVMCEELDDAHAHYVGSMGGPAIAIEMARGLPMAII